MVHMYNGMLLSHKEELQIRLFVVRWKDPESVKQCEVRKRKPNIIH